MTRLDSANRQDPPCVWVSAGVLNYRPCDRNYNCEECELFRALQGSVPAVSAPLSPPENELGEESNSLPPPSASRGVEGVVSAYVGQLTEGCALHLDRLYSPEHFWIQEGPPGEVLLGFDCQTIRILFPLDNIILPGPGVWVKRGTAMGWIRRGHLAVPLTAPLSGEVLEVNDSLVEELKEEGFPRSQTPWLVRLSPHESMNEIPDFLSGEAMLRWYTEKLGLIRCYLQEAVDPGVDTGQTLNDGGEPNRNLEEVLGSGPFQELLDELFRIGK